MSQCQPGLTAHRAHEEPIPVSNVAEALFCIWFCVLTTQPLSDNPMAQL